MFIAPLQAPRLRQLCELSAGPCLCSAEASGDRSRDEPEIPEMRTTVRSLLPLLAVLPMAVLADASSADWVAESRAMAQALGSELKAELGKAIEKGGPVSAIGVCKSRAPEIAARLSKESGADVGRTALRVRNPANAPDPLEKLLLEQFSAELASGGFELPLQAAFEINRGGMVERRYMQALPMDGVCLTCHGSTLDPKVAASIASEYPEDRATGFAPGELRGAISIIWPAVPMKP
jgi:hypothetical protein